MSQQSNDRAIKNKRGNSGLKEIPVRSYRTLSFLTALFFFLVYLYQLPAVSGDKDGSEFTLVLATGGVTHPTGYPLYTIFGHLYCVLIHALGAGWPAAANSFSALGGAVAIYFFCRLLLILLPDYVRRKNSAFIFLLLAGPVLLFGMNPIWTYDTTIAEVYSWHVAWALAFAVGAVAIFNSWLGENIISNSMKMKAAVFTGLAAGIGMSHHLTAMFTILPLAITLLIINLRIRRFGFREIAVTIFAGCIPLLSYGYIFLRAFHPSGWNWQALSPDFNSVITHITGSDYRYYLGNWDPSSFQRHLLNAYLYPLLIPAMLLLILKIFRCTNSRRILFTALLSVVLMNLLYDFNYGIPDPSSYFHVPLSICLACLPAAIFPEKEGAYNVKWFRAVSVALLCTGLILSVGWNETAGERKTALVQFETLVHDMWKSIPMSEAYVLWTDDAVLRLKEYQLLRHEKPGLIVLNPGQLPNTVVRNAFVRQHGFDPENKSVRLMR